MKIALIDPFEVKIPPPFSGNLERMWHGFMCGSGNHDMTVISVRKHHIDLPLISGTFRPNSMSATLEFMDLFDLIIIPANVDWHLNGVRLGFDVCLKHLRQLRQYNNKIAMVGQLNCDDLCVLVRSRTEANCIKSKRIKVIRHCSPIKKSSVVIDEKTVVMIGCVTQWGVNVAAEACRLNGQQLFVVGRHDLKSTYGAVMLGEINESQKIDLISQASHCVCIRHQNHRSLGSPSLIEPGLCGTPTIAIDFDDQCAIGEYLDDTMIVNANINARDMVNLLSVALNEHHTDRLNLKQHTADLYSCETFVRNVIDAFFDDISMFD